MSTVEVTQEIKETIEHVDRILDLVGEEGLILELAMRGIVINSDDKPESLPISDAILEFREYCETQYALGTWKTYKVEIKKFQAFLEANKLEGSPTTDILSETMMAQYLRTQSKTESTRNKVKSVLRNLFKYALEQGWVAGTVPKALHLNKPPKRKPKALEAETVKNLVGYAKSAKLPVRTYTILQTLAGTGCRISEVLNMRVKHFEWKDAVKNSGDALHSQVRVWGKRNPSGRDVNLGKLGGILKTYIVSQYGSSALEENSPLGDRYIFSASGGDNPLSINSFRETLTRISKKANISDEEREKVSPHAFRHSLATLLAAMGVDMPTIAEILGHKDINTTKIYTETSNSRTRKLVEDAQAQLEVRDIYD